MKFNSIYWLIFVCTSLIVVTSVRFNQNDFGIKSITNSYHSSDAPEYVAMVEHYRGLTPSKKINAPFSYRIAVPILASFLPFDPLTSINVINVISLLFCVIIIQKLIRLRFSEEGHRYLYALLFIYSFPTFYYGTIGILEAPSLLIITLGFYLIVKEKLFLLSLTVFLGAFVKETVILLIPIYCAYNITDAVQKRNFRVLLNLVLLAFLYLTAIKISKSLSVDQNEYLWVPEMWRVERNLARIRSYIAPILSLGFPFLFVLYAAVKSRLTLKSLIFDRESLACLAGLGLAILMYFYAVLSAWPDGRPLWISYPFLLFFLAKLKSASFKEA